MITLGNAAGWYSDDSVSSFVMQENTVYTAGGDALDRGTGAIRWKSSASGYEAFLVDDSVLLLGYDKISYLDARSGAVQRTIDFRFGNIFDAELLSGKLFVRSDRGLYALDAASGVQLWQVNDRGDSGFSVIFGRVYSGRGGGSTRITRCTGRDESWRHPDGKWLG